MFKHGFPPEWSTLKKLIWLFGSGIIGGASAVWKTVTGTLIHITDALASPMQKCEVSLEPIQDLHGQDSPYPAGGGVNKLPSFTVADFENAQIYGLSSYVSLPFKAGTWTVSTDAPTGYIWAGKSISSEYQRVYSGHPLTITLDSDAVIYFGIATNEKSSALAYHTQIEAGSTATSWSPYSNICPITGWTGCEVTRTGKNLYPYTTIPAYNYAWYSGSKALANATNPVFLKGGKKYAVSADQSVAATTSAIVRAWRADGTILENAPNVLNLKDPISGTTASYQASPKYYQLSTPNYAKPFTNTIEPTEDLWVDMRCSGDNRVGNDPMLQVGDSRTDYEPYSGTTLSVTFPDTVYGGSHEFVSGESIKTHNRLILKDLTWSVYLPLNNGGYRFVAYPFTSESVYPKTGAALIQNISNVFSYINPNTFNADTPYYKFGVYSSGTNRFVQISHPAETVEDLITSLTELDAILVYEVANPTEISLTPQEISTLRGENNVWSNSNGDTTIIYKAQAE